MLFTTLVSLLPIISGMAIEKRFSGDGTFYDTGLGACGWTNANNEMVAAIPTGQWDNGAHCGKEVTITANGVTATATIVDRCMGCKDGDLDMTPSLFDKFYPAARGRAPVTWSFTGSDGPVDGPSNSPTTPTTTTSANVDPTTAAATTAAPTTEAATTAAPTTTSSSSAAATTTASILPVEGVNSTTISVPLAPGNFTNLAAINAVVASMGELVVLTVVLANKTLVDSSATNMTAVEALFKQAAGVSA